MRCGSLMGIRFMGVLSEKNGCFFKFVFWQLCYNYPAANNFVVLDEIGNAVRG